MLCREIGNYSETGSDGKLKAILAFILSDITEQKQKPLLPVLDREFNIREFFAKKYNQNVTVDDLARELRLSTKQTAREVKKYTGNNFCDELIKKRMEIAKLLITTTTLPLTKISELVGYSSYSGFYKAYHKESVAHSKEVL